MIRSLTVGSLISIDSSICTYNREVLNICNTNISLESNINCIWTFLKISSSLPFLSKLTSKRFSSFFLLLKTFLL